MSPESEPFNWGNVVWHELGHVFAIQLSKNHVPRWFTEGLSEYETIVAAAGVEARARPRSLPRPQGGRLPHAVDMNRAFTHAATGEDMTVAYYAASQMLVFTVEQFGLPKVVDALKLWGRACVRRTVIQRAFGALAGATTTRSTARGRWRSSRGTRGSSCSATQPGAGRRSEG